MLDKLITTPSTKCSYKRSYLYTIACRIACMQVASAYVLQFCPFVYLSVTRAKTLERIWLFFWTDAAVDLPYIML